jgi:CRP/FNR family transcriptional regulator, cyclic AMP receptor protein
MSDNPLFEKYGQTVEPGKEIFHEGDHGDRMYIIQQGHVRITKSIDGREYELAVLEKGDFFGEMALVSRIERTATATAVDTVCLLSFDRPGFHGMIEKNAKIALNVIDKLCRRLQNANAQIQMMFQRNQRSLIALNLYSRFSQRQDGEQFLSLDKTLEGIAANLEVPAKLVQQYLEEFAESRLIAVKGNAVRLIDREGLTQLADIGAR